MKTLPQAALEDSLSKIEKAWVSTQFAVLNHRDQHGLFILGSLEEIFTLLEDNQVRSCPTPVPAH